MTDNHGKYIAGWIKVLENDSRAFYKAAKMAKKATELVLESAEAKKATPASKEAAQPVA